VPEVVAPGTGLLVPPADPPALAAAIRSLLEDPARARALGEAGAARMRALFDWRVTAAGTVAVYRELLHGTAPPPAQAAAP